MVSDFKMIFIRQIYKRYKIFREYLSFCFCCMLHHYSSHRFCLGALFSTIHPNSTPLHSSSLSWGCTRRNSSTAPRNNASKPQPPPQTSPCWSCVKTNQQVEWWFITAFTLLGAGLGEHTRKSYFRAELWPTTQNCFHAVARRVTCCPRWV